MSSPGTGLIVKEICGPDLSRPFVEGAASAFETSDGIAVFDACAVELVTSRTA
jgi:hypothetical protein